MNTKKDFDEYVNMVFSPIKETATFEERIGPPDELPAVIGLIAIHFSNLEDELSNCILQMLQLDKDRGSIITSELSFKSKINMFSSLYNNLHGRFHFNTFPGFEKEYFMELVKALNKSEELRNQVMHSNFEYAYYDNKVKVLRKKTTAKQKIGLKHTVEETDIIALFNISDYIGNIAVELDEFQIDIMTEKNVH